MMRIIMMMHKVLDQRDDIDRLQGGRGFACIKECVDAAIQGLGEYFFKNITKKDWLQQWVTAISTKISTN